MTNFSEDKITLRQAAEMALKEMQKCADDLDWVYDDYFEVIKALRQALAEPEQEVAAWYDEQKDELTFNPDVESYISFLSNEQKEVLRITADRKIVIAEDMEISEVAKHVFDAVNKLLAVPQRQWVGLTDDDIVDIENKFGIDIDTMAAEAIEAKLKEKNT